MSGVAFGDTPQGASLLRQIAKANSTWRRDGLRVIYAEAKKFFESPRHDDLASRPGFSTPAVSHQGNLMSLEQDLQANTAAIEANTLAMTALTKQLAAGGTASAGSTKATKTEKAESKPKATKTREELAAAVGAVKAKFNSDTAKELIKEVGKSEKLADVAEENIDALFAAATKKVEEGADEGL